jgi:hypothetical protein
MDFVVFLPACGRSVTDFWGWDAHEAQLRCPDDVDCDIWIWSTSRGLKPKFYQTTQTMATMGIFPFKKKPSRQNRESNPGPHDQYSETLTTRPRGWSYQQMCFNLFTVTQQLRWSCDTYLLTSRQRCMCVGVHVCGCACVWVHACVWVIKGNDRSCLLQTQS